jgi:hypothetical protein
LATAILAASGAAISTVTTTAMSATITVIIVEFITGVPPYLIFKAHNIFILFIFYIFVNDTLVILPLKMSRISPEF